MIKNREVEERENNSQQEAEVGKEEYYRRVKMKELQKRINEMRHDILWLRRKIVDLEEFIEDIEEQSKE